MPWCAAIDNKGYDIYHVFTPGKLIYLVVTFLSVVWMAKPAVYSFMSEPAQGAALDTEVCVFRVLLSASVCAVYWWMSTIVTLSTTIFAFPVSGISHYQLWGTIVQWEAQFNHIGWNLTLLCLTFAYASVMAVRPITSLVRPSGKTKVTNMFLIRLVASTYCFRVYSVPFLVDNRNNW